MSQMGVDLLGIDIKQIRREIREDEDCYRVGTVRHRKDGVVAV